MVNPKLSMPDRLYGASGGAKNLKVQVYNLIPATNTNGTITLTISRPSPFYTMELSTAEALQDQWTLTTEGLLFRLVSKPGVTIAGSSFNEIERPTT